MGEAVDVVALVTLHTGMAGFKHTSVLTAPADLTALVDLTAPVVQGHLYLLQRPLVLSVMRGAI